MKLVLVVNAFAAPLLFYIVGQCDLAEDFTRVIADKEGTQNNE